MILSRKEKQPSERKDYPIGYADWLAETGDVIEDATVSIVCLDESGDISLQVSGLDISPLSVAVWLSGGTDGLRYKVTVLVTTQGGRVDESEFTIRIRDY